SERSAGRKCRQQFSNPLADVGILFSGLAASPSSDCAKTHPRAKQSRSDSACSNSWGHLVNRITACRAVATAFQSILAIVYFCVTSCATVSRHGFSEPIAGWQTKTGQLMYRSPKTTLIGDALVRFS